MEPTINSYPNPQKNNKMSSVVIVIIILLVAAIGGFLITRQPKKTEEKKEVVVVTQSAPTPTEKPKIDKATVKIQVVNGTGTPGQAGIVVKALEGAGYSADNIKTGNAEKYDNATTSITARDNYEQIVTDIENLLKPTFDKFMIVSPNLDKNSEFDIIIVTGGKIYTSSSATPTISANPTPSLTATPTATSSATPTP